MMKGGCDLLINTFPSLGVKLPTINSLDSHAVIIRKLEVFCFKPLVKGGHDGRRVVGVLQTQCVTQLMDCYQENVITFEEKKTK